MASARPPGLLAALATCVLSAGPALAAEPAWKVKAVYTADIAGAVAGDAEHAGRLLDNLDLTLDGDLERTAGWRGGRPNEIVGDRSRDLVLVAAVRFTLMLHQTGE